MTVRPPEDSPGSLSAIGNDKALRMEGFFAACGLPDIMEHLRGDAKTRPVSSMIDGSGHAGQKLRHGTGLACRDTPSEGRPRLLPKPDTLPAQHNTARNDAAGQCCAASRQPPPSVVPTHARHLPTNGKDILREASRPATNHAACPVKAHSRRIRRPIVGSRSPHFPRCSSGPEARERKKKRKRKPP